MLKIDEKRLIKEMNLPKETKFLGYAIHLIESDEFLVNYQHNEMLVNMWWTTLPEAAKHFQSLKKAEKIKKKIKPEATIAWLFDTGPNIVATQPENYQ